MAGLIGRFILAAINRDEMPEHGSFARFDTRNFRGADVAQQRNVEFRLDQQAGPFAGAVLQIDDAGNESRVVLFSRINVNRRFIDQDGAVIGR